MPGTANGEMEANGLHGSHWGGAEGEGANTGCCPWLAAPKAQGTLGNLGATGESGTTDSAETVGESNDPWVPRRRRILTVGTPRGTEESRISWGSNKGPRQKREAKSWPNSWATLSGSLWPWEGGHVFQ